MSLSVVLDTNIYSADKLRSGAGFKSLERIADGKTLCIVVPFIVKREFQTQLNAASAADVASLVRSARDLIARGVANEIDELLFNLVETLLLNEKEIINNAQKRFDQWIVDHKVIVPALTAEVSKNALEAYFLGSDPFVSPKERKHIPDSFLYQAIVELAQNGPVFFVSQDKRLREKCSTIKNVAVFEDLTRVIASDTVQALIAVRDAAQSANRANRDLPTSDKTKRSLGERAESATVADSIAKLREFAERDSRILGYVIEHGAEKLAGQTISSKNIPGDDQEAYVDMFGSLDDAELVWEEAVYMGDSTFMVPYEGSGEMLLDYFVHKSEFWELEGRDVGLTDHNDHVWQVQEHRLLFVRGLLSIQLDEEFESFVDIGDAIKELKVDSIESVRLNEDKA